jgi:hypothetical protein
MGGGSSNVLYQWDKIKAEAPRARDSHTLIHVRVVVIVNQFFRLETHLSCLEVVVEIAALMTSISLIFVRRDGISWSHTATFHLSVRGILLNCSEKTRC